MLNYLIGAFVGGIVGYFVLYRLIGCSTGSCSISRNPYASIIYGAIIGLFVAGLIASPINTIVSEKNAKTPAIEYKKITAQEAKSRIDSGENIVIVDVRTETEYKFGHIPNAILIPNETITNSMPELLPELGAEILVYCHSGNRSAEAAKKLIAIGYTNVYDFGGIASWPYDTVTGAQT